MSSSSTLAVLTLLFMFLLSPFSNALPQPLDNNNNPSSQIPHIPLPPLWHFPPLPPLPPLPDMAFPPLPPLPPLPDVTFPPLPPFPHIALPPLPQLPPLQLPYPFENVYPTPRHDCPLNSTTHQPVNVAMVLDFTTLQRALASIFSLLGHTTCPTHVYFHFAINVTTTIHNNPRLQHEANRNILEFFRNTLKIIFPDINFDLTIIHGHRRHRHTVNSPAAYLAAMFPTVDKAIYVDSNVIFQDDIVRLWNTAELSKSSVTADAAPRSCNASFKYSPDLKGWEVLEKQRGKPCFFHTRHGL